jgi:hypothetical protein
MVTHSFLAFVTKILKKSYFFFVVVATLNIPNYPGQKSTMIFEKKVTSISAQQKNVNILFSCAFFFNFHYNCAHKKDKIDINGNVWKNIGNRLFAYKLNIVLENWFYKNEKL